MSVELYVRKCKLGRRTHKKHNLLAIKYHKEGTFTVQQYMYTGNLDFLIVSKA